MSITSQIAAIKERHRGRREYKSYDHYTPGPQSSHSRRVTIGEMKTDRLRIKNLRRAENGLPPKASYSEI